MPAFALAITVRGRRPTNHLMLPAAVLHAAALGAWLMVVAPANIEIGRWTAGAIPPGWESWRIRWEGGHALSFVLLLIGFCMLVSAVLTERRAQAHE